jgi:ABC-type antimicrobial peptide transport system, ATPase component
MQLLMANNVKKTYKNGGKTNSTNALNGINLKVESGEFVGIMGPSGSGKTTLLNILSGIDKSTSGDIIISGQSINEMKKDELALFRRRHLGFVFQEFNLLDSLSIKENIMLPMILDKTPTVDIINKTEEIFSLLNIADISEKYPYTVSGGQQQRVAIGRALVNNPDLIFADEPTGNLDSKSSQTVMGYFEKLNSEQKCTILIVTHDPFAASYCKRVVFIKDGLINTEILKKGERHNFFEQILECVAFVGGEQKDEFQTNSN